MSGRGGDDGVRELPGVPGLGGLYARGVAASIGAAAGRRRTVRPDALPTTRVAVRGVRAGADHLTAYQHHVGEPASDVLPAGFVHVLAFPVSMALMTATSFPLPLLGMVHIANHVEQHRAVHLGEALDVVASVRDLRAHRSGVTVDVVCEVAVGGAPVWRGVSTYLTRGMGLAGAGAGGDATGRAASGDAARAAATTSRSTPGMLALPVRADGSVVLPGRGRRGSAGAGDGSVPDSAPPDSARPTGAHPERPPFVPPRPTAGWRLAADTGRRYAAVSGDRNPIHTSALAARALGFPRAIAHGMDTAARALAAVGPVARGEAFVWDVDFAKPVLLPATVAVRVAPRDAGPGAGAAGDRPAFDYAVWDARRGVPHLTGSVVPRG